VSLDRRKPGGGPSARSYPLVIGPSSWAVGIGGYRFADAELPDE